MENQNQTDYGALSQMFSKYYKDKDSDKNTSSMSQEERLANYFSPSTGVEIFRTLPRGSNQKLWDEAYFHEFEVNDPLNKRARNGKVKKKLYCLSKNNPKVPKLDEKGDPILNQEGKPVLIKQRCPACEKQDAILEKQDPSVRGVRKDAVTEAQKPAYNKNIELLKESNQYQARKFFILKGIDKGKPKDGPKFWRIKEHYKNQGVMDKIIPAYQNFLTEHKKNPADPYEGCDLKLTMGIDTYMGNSYPVVSSVMPTSPKRLHEDDATITAWINDTTTWRDVYKEASMAKLTPEQYMERVVRQTDPYYDDSDTNNKKYVFPDPADAELQTIANTRSASLKSDDSDEEMASDLTYNSKSINQNLNANDVGTYNGGGSSIANDFKPKQEETTQAPPVQQEQPRVEPQQTTSQPQTSAPSPVEEDNSNDQSDVNSGSSEFDDLPF